MKPQKGEYYELLFMPEDNQLFKVVKFFRHERKPRAVVRSEVFDKDYPIPVRVLKSEHCRKIEPIIEPVVIAEDDMDEVIDAMDEVESMKSKGRIKGLFKRILARTV
ncbi:hypothetical protein [Macrococcus bovicus]|uniref:Uncharacterized protein n=1 Tax=Macrococcus bovicus TaxID=69968 RepID=A0A4R6BXF0_9STAP|nr:hypothetical protein [Macrococcus bovicus]TDM12677.1 hypothetical protein ERX55_10500 [Macrococcus bovicus]